MRVPLLLVAGLAAAATADVAGASTAAYVFGPGFATMEGRFVLDLPPQDAQLARRAIDADGDANVTQAELDAFLERVKRDKEANTTGPLIADITLDGAEPHGGSILAIGLDGVVGPTTSTAPATLTLTAQVEWTPGPGPTRTVHLTRPGGGEALVRVEGPPGSRIESEDVDGAPMGHFVEFPGRDADATIVFFEAGAATSKAPSSTAPGTAQGTPALAAPALALAALAAARKRS